MFFLLGDFCNDETLDKRIATGIDENNLVLCL